MTRHLQALALIASTVLIGRAALAQGVPPAPGPPAGDPPATEAAPAEPPTAEAAPTEAPPLEPEVAPPPAPVAEPPPAPLPFGVQWGSPPGAAPQADAGAQPTAGAPAAAQPEKRAFRLTTLGWDHSATTETVGIGRASQSRNPIYEMSFVLLPRFYAWEADDPTQALSIRGRLDLIREFTNSDVTTRRGEWTFTDATLFPQYMRNVFKDGSDISTDLGIRLPTLALPTSKVSANNGRIIQLGAMLLAVQKVPVLGTGEPVLQNFQLTARAAYTHWFTEAKVPTNDQLQRVRMGPDGRAFPGDQLSGAAFAEHSAAFDLIGELAVHERVKWTNWFAWQPAWKYELDKSTQACNIATGCVTPEHVDEPSRFTVVTLFNSEVAIEITKELELDIGYANLTAQLAPDGTRRNVFYSPDARAYVTLVAYLDEIHQTVTGARKPAVTAAAKPRRVATRP